MKIQLQSVTTPCVGHPVCGWTHHRLTGGAVVMFEAGESVDGGTRDRLEAFMSTIDLTLLKEIHYKVR